MINHQNCDLMCVIFLLSVQAEMELSGETRSEKYDREQAEQWTAQCGAAADRGDKTTHVDRSLQSVSSHHNPIMSSEDELSDQGNQKFRFKTDLKEVDVLPPEVEQRVNALRNLLMSNVKQEVEYYKELHQLDLKYQALYDASHEKRRQICSGEYQPSQAECEWEVPGDQQDVAQKLGDLNIDPKRSSVVGIPEFWLKVFQNCNETVLHARLEQIDEPILRHLQDITLTLPPTNTGFTLNFVFSPNEYFSNTVLTKEYQLRNDYDKEDPLEYDGPEVIRAKGCQIDWKPGKNPGIKIITKKVKPKGKGKGGPKLVKKEEKRETFFDFFKPPEIPEDTKKDEEETDAALELLNEDFDIGLNIKEKLIPKAVLYFTGEIGDLDMDDDDDDDEDFDDEDIDDDLDV